MNAEQVAKLCHEANAEFCRAHGDTSQQIWEMAPAWQRESAINGVKLHLANPGLPDSASHEAWMDEKLSHGWVFGELKDTEKKTHPCLVPFDQLPLMQQRKDALFKAIVEACRPLVQ